MFENIENISVKKVASAHPKTFEELGQAYGFVLYSTFVNRVNDGEVELIFKDVRDRACVYIDGVFAGVVLRDRQSPHIRTRASKDGFRVDVLIENLGRYWQCGPQGTLYVPGELLKSHNTLTVFELHPTENNKIALFSDKPNLDTLEKTVDLF